MRKKHFFILVLAITLFTACGRRDDYFYVEPTRHTLSVNASRLIAPALQQAAENLSAAWGDSRIFELNLNTFDPAADIALQEHYHHLRTLLSAGQGYDMFFPMAQHVFDFAGAGYLINIYTLMDLDPFVHPWMSNAGRDNFFHQPLRAREINGRLHALPVSFGFYHVSINTALPDSIITQFISYDSMSIADLMRLYLLLVANYPEYEDMHIVSGLIDGRGVSGLLQLYMDNFIDYSSRTVDLMNDDFIDFLYDFLEIFSRPFNFGGQAIPIRAYPMLANFRDRYVFMANSIALNPVLDVVDASHFLPGRNVFYHSRPITDRQGRAHNGTWAQVSFFTGGNYILAWEFAQYVIAEFTLPTGNLSRYRARQAGWGPHSMATPIARELFRPHLSAVFQEVNTITTNWHGGSMLRPNIDINTETAIVQRIEAMIESPMAYAGNYFPIHYVWDDYMDFIADAITAHEFARRLQSAVSIWFGR